MNKHTHDSSFRNPGYDPIFAKARRDDDCGAVYSEMEAAIADKDAEKIKRAAKHFGKSLAEAQRSPYFTKLGTPITGYMGLMVLALNSGEDAFVREFSPAQFRVLLVDPEAMNFCDTSRNVIAVLDSNRREFIDAAREGLGELFQNALLSQGTHVASIACDFLYDAAYLGRADLHQLMAAGITEGVIGVVRQEHPSKAVRLLLTAASPITEFSSAAAEAIKGSLSMVVKYKRPELASPLIQAAFESGNGELISAIEPWQFTDLICQFVKRGHVKDATTILQLAHKSERLDYITAGAEGLSKGIAATLGWRKAASMASAASRAVKTMLFAANSGCEPYAHSFTPEQYSEGLARLARHPKRIDEELRKTIAQKEGAEWGRVTQEVVARNGLVQGLIRSFKSLFERRILQLRR